MRQLALLAAFALLTAAKATAADPRWTMIPGTSMTVIGDQSAETLRDVAIQMEQFRAVVGGLIPNANRPLPLPTVVFVFGSRKTLESYVPVKNGRPASVDGLFIRRPDANHILLTTEGFDESAEVVFHEYTHLLVANAVRALPPWLNEGLAEYYGSYQLAANKRSALIGRPLQWRIGLLRSKYMPVRELIAVDSSAALHDEGPRRSIFYAESWALTHYLLSEVPDGAARINKFAAAFASGAEAAAAFTDAFGASPDEFDKQLANYVRRPALIANRFVFTDRLSVAAPETPRTLGAGEASAWLGDLQRRVNRDDEAALRIEAAVVKEPDAPMCQVALGLLRLSQDRITEGLEALNKADALARGDFMTQFVRGVALLRAERSNEANAAAAASALQRAVALNPDSSEAHAWLAYAQMQSPATLPQARTSIRRALELAPGRLEYQLRYADIRILEGEPNDVRALLTVIAANKYDPAAAEGARARINAILSAIQRTEQLQAQADTAASSSSTSIPTPPLDPASPRPDSAVRLQLRKVEDGEQRAYGELTRLECTRTDVRFHVQVDGAEMIASARRVEDVELIQYLEVKDFTVSCGIRTPADSILLTWRATGGQPAGRGPLAVAVEFVPKGYVP
jgi:Flp pilus assembly protein TadD